MIDPKAIDSVLESLIPNILEHKKCHSRPFVLGLSGLQGSGKSTWAAALVSRLGDIHGLSARTVSLDDLYLDHDDLAKLRDGQPGNSLLRTRGHPGTHDEALARDFFDRLFQAPVSPGEPIRWPAYDKSLHSGQGGRVPVSDWDHVPQPPDVLVFEGWCVGFQPLSEASIRRKWERAQREFSEAEAFTTATLAEHKLSDLLFVNSNLRQYCDAFMGPSQFNGFLHLSTDRLANVYNWRLDQERSLRRTKPGMTDDQVVAFVKGYMPGYELYLDHLNSHSIFQGRDTSLKHVKVLMDDGRNVVQITELQ